ncbi:hypothetical protein MTR62_06005 [Novosphingobium sp. 1949]|uniref:Uncharacterized protein n=1 Tax=Novosphingobium organovorum TaxID=2930092 RepID=A0ABT0BB16_9SPHN|nr:hypothetical protein [Novosphingobium organovorum]MCJ2182254.1 hypothetical protein [Novosphingobium organovorum]
MTPPVAGPFRAVLAGVALAGLAVPVAARAQASVIPKAFQGHWEEDTRYCSAPTDATLTLTATELHGWEAEGKVTKVEDVGPRAIVISADFSGEGETWSSSERYELSADGTMMTTANEQTTFQRFRCPKGK